MIGDLAFTGPHYFAPHYFGRRYFAVPVPVSADHAVVAPILSRLAVVLEEPRDTSTAEASRLVYAETAERTAFAEPVNRSVIADATLREIDG